MTPREPPVLHEGASLVVIAKDQPQYAPLPASVSPDGLVMTEWEPTAEELARLLDGGRVRIWLHTYGQPLVVASRSCPATSTLSGCTA